MAESHEARSQAPAKRRVWPQKREAEGRLAPEMAETMKRVAKHQRSAGLGRRKREAEGRLAPEMAESYEARSQIPAKRRGWPQTCGEAGRKALFAGNSGQVWVFRHPDTGGVHLEPAGVLFL